MVMIPVIQEICISIYHAQSPRQNIPHTNIIPLIHHDGAIFFNNKLLGTSRRIYGIKKMNNARL
jgi:hypothetical protein